MSLSTGPYAEYDVDNCLLQVKNVCRINSLMNSHNTSICIRIITETDLKIMFKEAQKDVYLKL